METCLAKLDYMEAFDKVKGDRLFEILQSKNIPNLLLKSIIEIISENKIKVKINNKLIEERMINHGVREGCPLSPAVFNINMNAITAKWNQTDTKATSLSTGIKINTLHFSEDQVIIADSDDDLRRGVFTLQNIAKNFGMEISPEKSKTTKFLG
jgi:hypothetical protein